MLSRTYTRGPYKKRATARGIPYPIARITRAPTAIKRGLYKNANKGIKIKLFGIGFVNSSATGTITDSTTASNVVSMGNYTSLSGLYDVYVVKAMKIKMIPLEVGGESVASYSRGTTVVLCDVDGTTVPSTVATAIEYGNSRVVDPRKQFSYYYKIPKIYRTQVNDFSAGWNTQNKDTTIRVVGDNYSNSLAFWIKKTTYYVTCYSGR